jgi:DNA polymerase-3 subunit beta
VKIEVSKGKVDVTSSSRNSAKASEQLTVDYSGPQLTISFNAQYVLDFLNVVESRCGVAPLGSRTK